mmetsp:Transcript_43808/g.47521  ORF Transcript_43808/g.47521 Transcript_43808/m.47521 type:complete len:246 (-) Transcript_43808:95-832(-)
MSGSELAPFVAAILGDRTIVDMQQEIALLKDLINKQLLLQVKGKDGSIYYERSLADLVSFQDYLHSRCDYFLTREKGNSRKSVHENRIEVPLDSINGLEVRLGGNTVQRVQVNSNYNDGDGKLLYVWHGTNKYKVPSKSIIIGYLLPSQEPEQPHHTLIETHTVSFITAMVYMTEKEYLIFEKKSPMKLSEFINWCKNKNKNKKFFNLRKNKKKRNKIVLSGFGFNNSMISGSRSLLQSVTGSSK